MHNDEAETTPGWSDRAACRLNAARLYFTWPSESAQQWGQCNRNLHDHHSDPMEVSSTLWLLDITDWWRQQEEMHSKHPNLSNVAHDIFSIVPHSDWAEASSSDGWDVIGWRQSNTAVETLRKKVIVWQFARASNGLLARDDPALDIPSTDNEMEKKEIGRANEVALNG